MASRGVVAKPTDTAGPDFSREKVLELQRIWYHHNSEMRSSVYHQSDDPRPLWRYVTEKDIVRSALDDIRTYSRVDAQGLVVPTIARCLTSAWTPAMQMAAWKVPIDEATKQRVKLLNDRILPLIEDWWDTSQPLVARWLDDETFAKRVEPYIIIAESISLAILSRADSSSSLGVLAQRILKSVSLQDFLLAVIVLDRSKPPWTAIGTFGWIVDSHRVLLQGVPKTVSGGAAALSGRLEELMHFSSEAKVPLNIRIIHNLLGSDVFRSILAQNDDLAVTIARRSWTEYPTWARKEGAASNKILLDHFTPIITLIAGTDHQINERLRILFEECDFASLIAKCLGIWGRQEEASTAMGRKRDLIDKILPKLCEQQPQLLKAALLRHRNYLTILDQLRSSTGKNVERSVLAWERLGTIAGLQEPELRAEAVAARRAAAGGLVGCSWYKCVMYRQESDQIMHWCMGCRKVVYCGYFCKTRDWDEGHKDQCEPETAPTFA